MNTARFQLEELTCPSCIKKIERTLNRQQGVKEVKVLFHSSKVKVGYDERAVTLKELSTTIEELGFSILATKIVNE